MNRTKVEWVKNPDGSQGYSWNPITGCLNTCEYCYARQLAHKRLKAKYLSNTLLPSTAEPNREEHCADPFYPRFWPERLKELRKDGPVTSGEGSTSKGIFACNMCEFFGDWIPVEWQRAVLNIVRANKQHRFYFLTKQPQNVVRFSPFPDNCWIGVTVCDKKMAQNAVTHYANYNNIIGAKLKFTSFEPLLEDVMETFITSGLIRYTDWIVIGSQTKPYNPPKAEWVEAIVEAADAAGKPVFLKDNLKPLLGNNLRQEIPGPKYSA